MPVISLLLLASRLLLPLYDLPCIAYIINASDFYGMTPS